MILVKPWWVPKNSFWQNIRFKQSRQNRRPGANVRRWRLLGITVTWMRKRK
jgi:hypothetical protein